MGERSALIAATAIVCGVCAIAIPRAQSENVPKASEGLPDVQGMIQSLEHGEQVFRPGAPGSVVHIQSGMICVPGKDQIHLIRLLIGPVAQLGDDAGCDYAMSTGKTTVYATRLHGLTEQSQEPAIIAALKAAFPDTKPIAGPMVAIYPGLNKPHAASFTVTYNSRPSITSVWISQEKDWLIEVRSTYLAESHHDPEFMAAMLSLSVQKSIHERIDH